MKIATRPVTYQSNIPTSQTRKFSINFDATMAYALMSGIAKDKISYPIREISTNAYDANSTVPFDVQLPTRMDPQFKVRDYGPGLPHDEIFSVYTTFGGSLKRDDDSQVGGLGYGSKSPFAYLISKTDGGASFQVTSIHNQTKTVYLMSLDETGMPTITTLSSTPATTEPTGIEVSFNIDNSDISEFHNSANRIYTFFPIIPSITPNNLIDPSLSDPIESSPTNQWSLYDTPNFYGPYVRMGCVAYPIDFSNLPSPYNDHRWPFRNSPILFEAAIGSLSFTTSREELGYDARTIQTIVSLLNKFEDDYAEKLQAKVDEAVSYVEACGIYVELQSTHPQTQYLAQQQKLTYKGKHLVNEHSFRLSDVRLQLVTPSEVQYLDKFTTSGLPLRSRINSTTRASIPATGLKDIKTVVYSSKPKKPFQVHRLKHHFSKPENAEPFIWIKPNLLELQQALTRYNFDDLKLVDIETLPLPDRATLASLSTSASNSTSTSTLKRSKTCKSTLCLDPSEHRPQKSLLDYADTSLQVFVLTDFSSYRSRQYRYRNYTVRNGHSINKSEINSLISLLKDHAPNNTDANKLLEHIWVFDVDAEQQQRPPNAIMLGDYFVQTFEPQIDPLILKTIQTNTKLQEYHWKKYANLSPNLDHSIVPQPFLDLCAKVQDGLSSNRFVLYETKNLYDTYSRLNPSISNDPEVSLADLLNEELKQLFKTYPLLELVLDELNNYTPNPKHLHHYFSLVNSATP